ncbi:MAG TPA: hypothetical protein VN577_20565 [Terriglobales bacterium]|nr:hypothetical protein [Terriglobales bacterium]
MVLGISLSAFTLLHVVISLAGIASGFVVVYGLFNSKRLPGWTAIFLSTTVLTSLTGYLFSAEKILPSHIVGAISFVVLLIALFALYAKHLAGRWRWIYIVTGMTALYLNCFVAVVQAFAKIPSLKALAPKQTEPPFAIAQFLVLAVFIAIGIRAVKKFHISPIIATRAARAS